MRVCALARADGGGSSEVKRTQTNNKMRESFDDWVDGGKGEVKPICATSASFPRRQLTMAYSSKSMTLVVAQVRRKIKIHDCSSDV